MNGRRILGGMFFNRMVLAAVAVAAVWPAAWGLTDTRFNNEASDTLRINAMLSEAADAGLKSSGQRIAFFARHFIDTPYGAATLEKAPEMVTVNLDTLDCTTLVDLSIAMAYTLGEGRTSWRDVVYNLERMRYRGGEADGYASRLHYVCDWFVDNIHRGNFEDATRLFPRINYVVRTIDYMSYNRDKYPALADSAEYERIKNVEIGYRGHRFPYIKTVDLAGKETKAALREGDVLALVSSAKNIDVTHMGIVVMVGGEPYLLHASSREGCVIVTERPLADYMKRQRNLMGVRVLRLKE